jgi:hypothetical protein
MACGLVALALVLFGESGRLFRPLEVRPDVEPTTPEIR